MHGPTHEVKNVKLLVHTSAYTHPEETEGPSHLCGGGRLWYRGWILPRIKICTILLLRICKVLIQKEVSKI
jgi:hypothetical protein